MADQAPSPPPIFNLQAYRPAEIKEAVEKVGVKEANLPPLASFMLAIVAGGGIGFGALCSTRRSSQSPGSSTISYRSNSAISWAAPALSVSSTGRSTGQRSATKPDAR